MLIVSSIRLMFDLSVFRVPRPCLYMLGSSSQPKCIACVNMAYTRCIRTLESITPDHHVVLQNNEPSQRCSAPSSMYMLGSSSQPSSHPFSWLREMGWEGRSAP